MVKCAVPFTVAAKLSLIKFVWRIKLILSPSESLTCLYHKTDYIHCLQSKSGCTFGEYSNILQAEKSEQRPSGQIESLETHQEE